MDDPAVVRIPVVECGEALVDLGLIPSLMMDRRFEDPCGRHRMVRKGLAERLSDAASGLPGGLRLLIVEGYRPLTLQAKYFYEYVAELRDKYPGKGEHELRSLASRYVAPPHDLPPHCAGAAVDLTLAYEDGSELDMGTKVNDSPEESGGRCYTSSLDISGDCRVNRNLLSRVLEKVGLVNYPTEWWHWSYGDRYWSLKTGSEEAIYDLIEFSYSD